MPMPPITIRLLGATVPFLPKAEAGMIVGMPIAMAAVPINFLREMFVFMTF
jgi:hypothetical protein